MSLDWIAEEIEAAIRGGKLKEITYSEQGKRRTRKTGYKTVPYDDQEQMGLSLKTLYNYFIVLYDVWAEALDKLPEVLKEPQLHVEIRDPDTDEVMMPFTDDYMGQRSRLEGILREALSVVNSLQLRGE